jgi:hypothetical protein
MYHARIGRDAEALEPRILRWLVPFEHDFLREILGGRFHRGDELDVILQSLHRRHEDVQHAIAGFSAHRGARDPSGGFIRPGRTLGHRSKRADTQVGCGTNARELRTHFRMPRQWRKNLQRIGRMNHGEIACLRPRQRIERQAQAER